jgi:hypothetical protein
MIVRVDEEDVRPSRGEERRAEGEEEHGQKKLHGLTEEGVWRGMLRLWPHLWRTAEWMTAE